MNLQTRVDVNEPFWNRMGEDGREAARRWLRECGGDPNITRAVEVIGEGHLIAEVLVEDNRGRRVGWTRVKHFCRTPPPWWREWVLR